MTVKQQRLGNLRRNQYVLYIVIFSLVTIVIWITGSLISSQKKTGIEPHLLELAKPLNPNLDQFVISRLESKRSINEDNLRSFQVFKVDIASQNALRSQLSAAETAIQDEADLESSLNSLLAPEAGSESGGLPLGPTDFPADQLELPIEEPGLPSLDPDTTPLELLNT
jgi:hypothetical protein